MLRTPLCDLLGVDAPIIQAAIPPYTSPELVSAVSNAGGLGSYASAFKPVDQVREDIARIRTLTDRPFGVNVLIPAFDQEVFDFVLSDPPPVVSFAVGHPGERIQRAKDAGARVIAQVHTVEQAREIASAGADVIIAQGSEAGGLTGSVSLMPLLPQVVDAVAPIPVVAAGGIADGRGLAAALVLGAQGVNLGTRFIASEEASSGPDRRQQLVEAQSDQAQKSRFLEQLLVLPGESYQTSMRSLQTAFIKEWDGRESVQPDELERLRAEIFDGSERDRIEDYVFAAGQSVGLIADVRPAAEIIEQMVSEAEHALAKASGYSAPTV